jgi:putative Holliday junction resolvase
MGRILALDLGEKSLGICVSDEMQIIPIPIENYIFERNNLKQAEEKVIELVYKYDLEMILLGYPLRTDGKKSDATLLSEKFYRMLKDKINICVRFVNEAYSTQEAIEMLSQTIKDKNKIKSLKDVASAYIILTDYLNTKA